MAGDADRGSPDASSTVELLTPPGSGAIAVILIAGDALGVLERMTGIDAWPVGRPRLADLAGEDRGLAVRLTETAAWLMPHGGPAVTAAVLRAAREASGVSADAPDAPPDARWPEAADAIEAAMLEVLAAVASPAAIARLAAEPERWRRFRAAGTPWTEADAARSRRLDHLLRPPVLVLAGPPNIGKSTLANTLAGRTLSITADEPGTTRDATSATLVLDGLAVSWHDAPGLRETDDPIEREAIDRVARLLEDCDLLVAAADAGSDWPRLPREPDLRIALRPDLGRRADADLTVDGRGGGGLPDLERAIRRRLVPDADLDHPGPWDAGGRLRAAAAQKPIDETPQST
ncbi:MAG: GTPase [Planctomycetota bacterium]